MREMSTPKQGFQMRSSLVPLLSTLVVFTGSSALAQDSYATVFGGIGFIQDSTFNGAVGGNPETVELQFDEGFGIGIAYGRTFDLYGGIRGEVELSYQDSDVDTVFFSGNGPAAEINVAGDYAATRLFANAFKDFDAGTAWTPYIGAGIGVAATDLDVVYGPGVALSQSDTVFAAQLIAGTSYALSDSLSLTADVRYIRDFNVSTPRFNPAGALTGVLDDDVDSLNINVGVRFNF